MPVHRERVDPIRTPDARVLVHRRWLIPDDVRRPVPLSGLAPLWRGLAELGVLDTEREVRLERLQLLPEPSFEVTTQELPALPSAGALLAGAGQATLVTQMIWTDEEGRRDPYADEDGEPDPQGFRDYTLYAVDAETHLFLPLPPARVVCGACKAPSALEARRFGEGALLELARACPSCKAPLDLARDKGELRTGVVFLLEELVCRAALSIELPRAPLAEELPDAQVSGLLRTALGATDELPDDGAEAAE